MTSNLKKFMAFSVVWSILFYTGLNWGVIDSEHRWPVILMCSLIYGIGFNLMGKRLGRADDGSKVRYSLGLAYGAVATLIPSSFGIAWLLLFHHQETWHLIFYLLPILIIFSYGMLLYRRTIKGMKKEKLFQ